MYIDNDLMTLVTTGKMDSGQLWGTGMLIVHPITRKLLMGKRTDTGNMCSPGGKVEKGESPLMGVLRETKEESNITCNKVKFYDMEMHVAENGKSWTSFMFICDDCDCENIVNQQTEVEPWDWYSVEEVLAMDLFPPTRKSLERAIDMDLIYMEHESDNFIPFVECPTSGFTARDSCNCAYSYSAPEQIFTSPAGPIWD